MSMYAFGGVSQNPCSRMATKLKPELSPPRDSKQVQPIKNHDPPLQMAYDLCLHSKLPSLRN